MRTIARADGGKTAAVLGCRAESLRLYGKPLQTIGAKSILEHLVTSLRRSGGIDDIVLAIADSASQRTFIAFAQRHGLPYVIGSESDMIGRLIQGAEAVGADVIVRATTDCPFVYWENIEAMEELHRSSRAALTITEGLPQGAFVELISVDALKASHADWGDRNREFCSSYIAEHPETFNILRVPAPAEVLGPALRLTVDTPEDLTAMRAIWYALAENDEAPTVEEIVAFLRGREDIVALNAMHTSVRFWK